MTAFRAICECTGTITPSPMSTILLAPVPCKACVAQAFHTAIFAVCAFDSQVAVLHRTSRVRKAAGVRPTSSTVSGPKSACCGLRGQQIGTGSSKACELSLPTSQSDVTVLVHPLESRSSCVRCIVNSRFRATLPYVPVQLCCGRSAGQLSGKPSHSPLSTLLRAIEGRSCRRHPLQGFFVDLVTFDLPEDYKRVLVRE